MGMFDTIWAKCPKCYEDLSFQTKGGDRCLENYELDNAPDDAMSNVNRHSPVECKCGNKYEVDIANRKLKQVTNGSLPEPQTELQRERLIFQKCWCSNAAKPNVSGSLPDNYELTKLYKWLMDEKREPAITSFTSGITRNIASEIEYRLRR